MGMLIFFVIAVMLVFMSIFFRFNMSFGERVVGIAKVVVNVLQESTVNVKRSGQIDDI